MLYVTASPTGGVTHVPKVLMTVTVFAEEKGKVVSAPLSQDDAPDVSVSDAVFVPSEIVTTGAVAHVVETSDEALM